MSKQVNPPSKTSLISEHGNLTSAQRTLLADVYLLLLKRRIQRKHNEKAATPEKFGDPTGAAADKAVPDSAATTPQCTAASSPLQVKEAKDVI